MNEMMMDTRSRRMLELLSQGAGSKLIAKELGYQEGTMRVYLHNLYRKIGVGNKTEAVIWYLRRTGIVGTDAVPARQPAPSAQPDDLFGDMALAEGLYAALGVMSRFIGPYGRVWEIGVRLSGEEADPRKRAQRERARGLWNALLEGDFGHGKRVYDVDEGSDVMLESPSEAVLLVSLLAAGGYTGAAEQVAARLTDRRRARLAVSAREATLVKLLPEAFDPRSQAYARLGKLAADRASPPTTRQLAMVLLFHAYRAHKDFDRARQAAAAIWGEAEEARKDLQAMGDRALGGRPPAAVAKAGVREKAAAAR